ncbi:MAG TPA: RNB domain-containing ribonuclease, partial [Arthrobacter sp.]|nr:RNB domain-containing ribonuclease [Arthrobacter sp.]
RLVDRFVLVICEALSNGRPVPAWARQALPSLPEIMAYSDQLAARMERLALDTVEAALLINHIGQEFDAVVLSGSKPAKNGNGNGSGNAAGNNNGNGNGKGANGSGPSGVVQIAEPAVTARCEGEMEPGTKVRVRLISSDIRTREIRLELVG